MITFPLYAHLPFETEEQEHVWVGVGGGTPPLKRLPAYHKAYSIENRYIYL